MLKALFELYLEKCCSIQSKEQVFRRPPPFQKRATSSAVMCLSAEVDEGGVTTEQKHKLHPAREEEQILKSHQLMPEATSSFFLTAPTSIGCKETFIPCFTSGV